MSNGLEFNYYYGKEADQFTFYRIPKLLFTDTHFNGLSNDAKLLYGLMLDRMSLSIKNGWQDDQDRTYIIYTVEQIAEDLGCGKDKAVKVSGELDTIKGIGLIEKVKRGLGKPDIIYVKSFVIINDNSDNDGIKSNNTSKSACKGNNNKEFGKSEFKDSENQTSRVRKNISQEVGETVSNNTNISDKDNSENNLINLSERKTDGMDRTDSQLQNKSGMYSLTYEEYIEFIKDNIDYEILKQDYSDSDMEYVDTMVELMAEIVITGGDIITISDKHVPKSIIISRFEKYDMMTVQYVVECLRNNTSDIKNIKNYMLATLYNAPITMNAYYKQKVNHDLYGYKQIT